MECSVCNYEYTYTWSGKRDKENLLVIKGNEPFIKIIIPVELQNNDDRFEADIQRPNGQNEKIFLWGCPKCKTVQFEIY